MIIHVAILDADIPVRSVFAARGLYSAQFRRLLEAAAGRMNNTQKPNEAEKIEIHTTAYDIVGGSYPALDQLRRSPRTKTKNNNCREPRTTREKNALPIDALIVTGALAGSYEFDEYPWIATLQEYIQRVWRDYPAVKLFGSCFGHQLIAQALLSPPHLQGKEQLSLDNEKNIAPHKTDTSTTTAHVEKCPLGAEIGIHPITLNPAFVSAIGVPGLSELRNGEMRIQLFHGDRVISSSPQDRQDQAALPAPWLNIGSTALSPIQGLYYPGRVLTYQGHFEFDAWMNRECVVACAGSRGWTKDMIEQFLEQVGPVEEEKSDSETAAEVVVWFFADGLEKLKSEEGLIQRFTRFMKRIFAA